MENGYASRLGELRCVTGTPPTLTRWACSRGEAERHGHGQSRKPVRAAPRHAIDRLCNEGRTHSRRRADLYSVGDRPGIFAPVQSDQHRTAVRHCDDKAFGKARRSTKSFPRCAANPEGPDSTVTTSRSCGRGDGAQGVFACGDRARR